mgnify:CR=1 FL=1
MSSVDVPAASAGGQSNQFIRPMSPSDTASAAARLALKGADFAASEEVAAAIEGGVAAELAFAVMAALGSRFEQLADEDQLTLAELITATPSAAKATDDNVAARVGPGSLAERDLSPPLSPSWTGGDEAAGSPAASIIADAAEKGALSSLEDDSVSDESPCGDGRTVSVELPVDRLVPAWRRHGRHKKGRGRRGLNLTSLARRLTRLSFGHEPEVPPSGPVDPPGPVGTTLGRYPKGPKRYGYARAPAAAQAGEGKEPEESDSDASDGAPTPPNQGPAAPPGGRDEDPPDDGDGEFHDQLGDGSANARGEHCGCGCCRRRWLPG